MIEKKLGAQNLGAKIIVGKGGEEGTLKAYNNVNRIVFVFIKGKMEKHPYTNVTLQDDGDN